MKAQFVYENINFNREGTSYEKLGIGKHVIPPIEELLKNVRWAQSGDYVEEKEKYRDWITDAMKPERSSGYRKYTQWAIIPGHITRSASSVFEGWIEEMADEITLQEVKDALNDMWPNTDEDAKEALISYAKRKGLE